MGQVSNFEPNKIGQDFLDIQNVWCAIIYNIFLVILYESIYLIISAFIVCLDNVSFTHGN